MRKKETKRGAHAATYLAVWWTLFSAFGVFDWLDARRSSAHSFSYIPFVIWGIHLFLIGLSFYAWKKEQPREVLWIGDEDELLDIDPREIDLEKEKLRLRKSILSTIFQTIMGIGMVWLAMNSSNPEQKPSALVGLAILGGIIMLWGIAVSLFKYFVLQYRSKPVKSK